MSIERKLIGTVDAASGPAVYVEDVFSTWLYNATNATQTITNGIDLATKGGLVWCKSRSISGSNVLFSTTSANTYLNSNNTSEAQGYAPQFGAGITSYNVDGFTLGSNTGGENFSGTMVSWTFRKQAKFFDVVTYTGNGVAGRQIAHNLGAVPGMIIVKGTSTATNWPVYHKSLANTECLRLDLTNAAVTISNFGDTTPTSTNVYVGSNNNINGITYVAYLFADSNSGGFGPAGTDSVVACGSYTGNGSASGPTVTLGWEPQFVIVKNASATGDWNIFDNMRGIPTGSADPYLFANTNAAEATTNGDLIDLTPTGFVIKSTNAQVNTSSNNYIYLAIRRGPMRTPTDATKVFAPVASNLIASASTVTTSFPVDLNISASRGRTPSGLTRVFDRLRGSVSLVPSNTSAEETGAGRIDFSSNTSVIDTYWGTEQGASGQAGIYWNFRRAPGFFDVVCYTGTGSARTVAHNLGVAPELIIVRRRSSAASNWPVWTSSLLNTQYNLYLNSTIQSTQSQEFTTNSTPPTSTIFPVEQSIEINQNDQTYVAYLFATCPGVSKVGSYTGNGSSQTIDCGFASGARFVLIKRTDAAGDWYVWDTARGIVSDNDPRLSLNTTAAEVTTDDSIDPASSGFIVNQLSATNINVSSATYIYLSIA